MQMGRPKTSGHKEMSQILKEYLCRSRIVLLLCSLISYGGAAISQCYLNRLESESRLNDSVGMLKITDDKVRGRNGLHKQMECIWWKASGVFIGHVFELYLVGNFYFR